jgi:hypothetical protein
MAACVNTVHVSFVVTGTGADDQNSLLPSARKPEDSMRNPARGRLGGLQSRRCSKHSGAGRTPVAKTTHGQAVGTDQAAPDVTAGAILPRDSAAHRTAPGEVIANAMELAIGLLTASQDSPELEAWAVAALTPMDADGLGDFMAGLHVVSELLLRELHEATGESPEAILQRLAIQAEHRRGTPSSG